MLAAVQTSGPPGGSFPGQPPLVPPDVTGEGPPSSGGYAVPGGAPSPAVPHGGYANPQAPPPPSSPALAGAPSAYVPPSSLRSITQRMPTGQMQAIAADWAGDWNAAPPTLATPGHPAQPPPGRMPTGTHAVVQNLPPPPPLPSGAPSGPPPGVSAHPGLVPPVGLAAHPPAQLPAQHPAPQLAAHTPGHYPTGHALASMSSAAVATTMPGAAKPPMPPGAGPSGTMPPAAPAGSMPAGAMPTGTVAAHQTGPHSMVTSSVGPTGSSPQGLIPFPVPGATLTSSRGTYVVGQLIGDGQYGSVYECMGPFDQLYALKMLRPSNKPYQAVKDEWVREMQRLESFRHPNIVYIHDAFEDNYLFYLALERCDTSLRALARSPLPDPMFLEITRQLLMALAYLHDSGLVHSDLHAGNVLISQLETHPIVKLTDFGVAHQLDGSTHWYRPQVANPKIIAPELLTAGYTTRQSDLYQLGLLMFQMHTGRPAIDVDNMQYGETTRMIAEGTPRVLAEALSSRFSPVIAKLLRRRDAYRYQSARDVWDDLRLR